MPISQSLKCIKRAAKASSKGGLAYGRALEEAAKRAGYTSYFEAERALRSSKSKKSNEVHKNIIVSTCSMRSSDLLESSRCPYPSLGDLGLVEGQSQCSFGFGEPRTMTSLIVEPGAIV